DQARGARQRGRRDVGGRRRRPRARARLSPSHELGAGRHGRDRRPARGRPRAAMRVTVAVAVAVALASTGCDKLTSLLTSSFATNEFSGDPFPIGVETTSGALVVGPRRPGGPPP